MKKLAIGITLIVMLALAVTLLTSDALSGQVLGTWREGFKAANAKALTFNSWNGLWDWAEKEGGRFVPELRRGRSTDLVGGRHSFIDTRAGGYRDACIGILDEMRFIGLHNSGDTNKFFKMMREWMPTRNLDEIIPPGHF